MTRAPRFRPEDLDGDRRALYDALTSGPRSSGPQLFPLTDADGVLRGPFDAMLLSPALGDALQRLGAAVRFGSALSDRVREMAVLVVAAHQDSAFERESHEAVGRAVGLSEAELQALSEGRIPDLTDPAEATALALTRALVAGDVPDDVWAACVPALGEATVFELSTLVGYYTTLALQLRVFRV